MKRLLMVVLVAAVLAMLLACGGMALADTSGNNGGGSEAAPDTSGKSKGKAGQLASFEGKTIDLSQGWRGAEDCVVYASDHVECYATHDEADAALGYSPAEDPETKTAKDAGAELSWWPWDTCTPGWVCLFEHKDFKGRRLRFRDDYCQNLTDYGFNDQVSSWWNNQSGDDATLYADVGCKGESHTISGKSRVSYVGDGFNDKASSIKA